jgi:hypothetical protein
VALTLDILANTSAFVSEMESAGASVEEISDALTLLKNDSVKASVEAERALGKVGTSAEDAASDVESAAKDSASSLDQITTGAEDAGTGIGGLSEVAERALAGDIPGAAQAASDALGGIGDIVAIGGPVVTALGALAGIVGETLGAAAEEAKQRTSDMFDDMVESGENALSVTFQLAEAQKLIGDDEALAATQRWADSIGIDLSTAVLAASGNADALATAQQALNDKMDSDAPGRLAGKYIPAIQALNDTATAADSAVGKVKLMDQVEGALKDTGAAADTASGQVGNYVQKLGQVPSNVDTTVKVILDDSAVRNYRPSKITLLADIYPTMRQPL